MSWIYFKLAKYSILKQLTSKQRIVQNLKINKTRVLFSIDCHIVIKYILGFPSPDSDISNYSLSTDFKFEKSETCGANLFAVDADGATHIFDEAQGQFYCFFIIIMKPFQIFIKILSGLYLHPPPVSCRWLKIDVTGFERR